MEELTNAQIGDEVGPRLVELLDRIEARYCQLALSLNDNGRLTAHNTSPCP